MKLRDYQIELSKQGSCVLKKHKILYYAIKMRVGKTVISLETCRLLGFKRVLFATKKNAINDILSDYKNFGFENNFILDVINHESVHKLNKNSYDCIIVDEAHSLGAFPKASKRAVELKEIVKNKYLILLSGTPTPESYSQIYHQLYISDHSPFNQWPSFYKWAKDGFVFITDKRISGYIIKDYSGANKQIIKQYVNKLFITYTQEQAGFIVTESELKDKIVYVDSSQNLIKLIKKVVKDRVYEFKNKSLLVADTAVKLKSKIHQMCSGTVISEDGPIVLEHHKADFILNNYKNKKLVIFYLYQAEGDLLKSKFPNWTNNNVEFNKSKNLVFISQFQSGSRGINLETADVIIFYNIHFSSEIYQQARQRGQTKDKKKRTELHWLFTTGGIEDKIYQRVINKQSYTTSYFAKDFLS